MNFNIELAQQLLDSPEKFPVSFNSAWVWLGYKRKDNAKKSLLNSGFIENEDYLRFSAEPTTTGIGGDTVENTFLTIDCFKMWGMAAGTVKGKEVRKYFLECEKIAKLLIAQRTQTATPELPVVMPTQKELDYMRSRAWEKAEMMGHPVSSEVVKRKTGFARAAETIRQFREQAEKRAIESGDNG